MKNNTKIVATIGPASESEEMLEALIKAGMNIARLNFSHASHIEQGNRIEKIRKISKRLSMPIGILQDLQGPKIRVGNLERPIQLSMGEVVCLFAAKSEVPITKKQLIPIDFVEFFDAVELGGKVLLDDGRLVLKVISIEQKVVYAEVIVDGILLSHKGINLPGINIKISGFTSKDEKDLAFGLSHGVDAVAISFVRNADDVRLVRYAIDKYSVGGNKPLLIAKLEKPEAIMELAKILDYADGVMVARGDLGVELPPERVPILQKIIIREANKKKKLVIVATQMLQSMTSSYLPTRAEISDVANAVLDGADAVMLSAESSVGKYPIESVQMMSRIIGDTESELDEFGWAWNTFDIGESDAVTLAHGVKTMTNDPGIIAVACFTFSGSLPWLLSKMRLRVGILSFTSVPETFNQLAFIRGVEPYLIKNSTSLEELLIEIDYFLLKSGIQPGKQVLVACGYPDRDGAQNMILIHTVGSLPTFKLARKLAINK